MIVDVNIDTVIPDRSISVADGGIVPLGKIRETKKFDIIRSIARKYSFSLYDPIEDLPEEIVSLLVFGSDELFRVGEGASSEMVAFPGIVGDINEKITCPVCNGTRLNKETTYFKIDGKTISEVSAMEIGQLQQWFNTLNGVFGKRESAIARDILKELKDRVSFLMDVGLDYLSLNRATASLSGGESQRIRLATQIGSKLVNVLYILDEPSIGLHQRDNRKLIASLKKLRDEGKTVAEIAPLLEDFSKRVHVCGILDTLTYLQKGGRIPKTLATVGNMLKIKPVVAVEDGSLVSPVKVRGTKAAKKAIWKRMESVKLDPEWPVYFIYTSERSAAEELLSETQEQFDLPGVRFSQIGSVIGAHLGPNAFGFAYVAAE